MSEDNTIPLSEADRKYDTTPGITAVLERINALADALTARMDETDRRLDAKIDDFRIALEAKIDGTHADLGGKIKSLRLEREKGFRTLSKKIDTPALDILDVRTDQRFLEDRLDEIGRKPA